MKKTESLLLPLALFCFIRSCGTFGILSGHLSHPFIIIIIIIIIVVVVVVVVVVTVVIIIIIIIII